MALFDLNRSNDTPVATLQLASITPRDFPTLPAVVPSVVPANGNVTKPRYNTLGDWAGGAIGDDVDVDTALVALANSSGGAAEADYTPRTEAARATQLGVSMAVDVARARGWIAPNQPYLGNAVAPAAPVITSLSPNTAVAVTGPELLVTITGTGFTPWSTVLSGNFPIPSKYVDATHLTIYQNPKVAVAGVVQVVVIDHDVNSAPSNFTFT